MSMPSGHERASAQIDVTATYAGKRRGGPRVQAQAVARPEARRPPRQLPWRRIVGIAWLVAGAMLFAASMAGFAVEAAAHTTKLLSWYDLNVYNDAGLITRELPSYLYSWELKSGVQFTYTPFAAVVFAVGSLIRLVTLQWIMTVASVASIPVTIWLTLGAMGRRGIPRASVTLALSAVALWIEPVIKALFLGQIELLLLLLVVRDLTLQDKRWWKGIGIGLAAGIKLVPLLLIPYLLLAGKIRQALVATAAFAGTIIIGFIVLPGPSASYWLTGYFVRPGRTGGVDSLVNQSILGAIARMYGSVVHAQAPWLPVAIAVAAIGLVAAAMLSRTGKEVPAWVLIGITALLVSPISWDHHWVWIIPFLAMLAGYAMTARRLAARIGLIAAVLVTAGVMGSWPWRYSGPQAFIPRRGLLGWFVHPPQVTHLAGLHGWQLVSWNLFVVVGLVIFLVLVAWAWLAWRSRPRPEPPSPGQPSPISSLLARADHVLKSGASLINSGSGPPGQ
jgi:alpha-1,2-mannosyltransferase